MEQAKVFTALHFLGAQRSTNTVALFLVWILLELFLFWAQ